MWDAKLDGRAVDVRCTDRTLHIRLADGREVSAPVSWFPKLAATSAERRKDWRLIGGGVGIQWESLDEDISIEQLLVPH